MQKVNAFHRFSFRITLLIVCVLIMTVVFISVFNNFQSKRAVMKLSEHLTKEITDSIMKHTEATLSPIADNVELLSAMVSSADVLSSEELLTNLMWGQLINAKEAASIFLADETGNFLQTRRSPEYAVRVISRNSGRLSEVWSFTDEKRKVKNREERDGSYDPRTRPWYQNSTGKTVKWSDLYVFSSTGALGYTVSFPVYADGVKTGVAAVDITVDSLSQFLKETKIAKDGAVVIYDEKQRVVASSLDELNYKETDGKKQPKLISDIGEAWVKNSLQKADGAMSGGTAVKVDGEKYILSVSKFSEGVGAGFSIAIVIPEDVILGEVNTTLIQTLVISAVILLVAALVIVMYISTSFSKNINKLENYINTINSTKNIGLKAEITSKGEIGLMTSHLNSLFDSIKDLISKSIRSSSDNMKASEELRTTVEAVAQGIVASEEISNDISMASQSARDEIAEFIRGAEQGKEGTMQAREDLEKAKREISMLSARVTESAQEEIEIAGKIESLASEAEQVKDVLAIISEIADQTNLLALNAAIEAARAGEHGRGFAVVADEVRKLAEKTQQSLNQINSTLEEIVQKIIDASNDMGENSQKIQELSGIAEEAQERVSYTADLMTRATEETDIIVSNFVKTGQLIDDLVENLARIDSIIQQNSTSADQIRESSENIIRSTKELDKEINLFKV